MGENISTVETHILDRIDIVQEREDPFFGKIEIFRLKESPYEYLFDYKKNYVNDAARMSRDNDLMQKLKSITHPNLAKIFYSELREGTSHPR